MMSLNKLQAIPIVLMLLWGCSDSDPGAGLCGSSCQARQMAELLSDRDSPFSETVLRSLIENELGSEPFYLVEYWHVDGLVTDSEELLSQYDVALNESLDVVGAHLAIDNQVFNQVTNTGELTWTRVRVVSYPSPQAYLDVLSDPHYQQAVQLKHQATVKIRGLWIAPVVAVDFVDPHPDRAEFFMSNLNTFRDMALYADGTSHGLTGVEANELYTDVVVGRFFPQIGAFPVVAGTVEHLVVGSDADWDFFALVYYPSVADLLTMITDPVFQEFLPNKHAGLRKINSMMTAPLMSPQLP